MSLEVIIFGFSGSGKSTMANMISKKYNLRVIHPSGIIRNILAGEAPSPETAKHNEGFWESKEGVKTFLDRLKTKEPVDIKVDKILLQEVEKGDVVIDTRNLPWLTTKGIRFYLQADIKTRAKRVSKRSHISYNESLKIIEMKDTKTTKLFLDHYGFNIQKDHDVFDLILTTDALSEKEVGRKLCEYIDIHHHK